MFYYGEDRSHCGSCWERSDEEVHVMLTDLSEEEVKEKFSQYIYEELWDSEKYSPLNFLKWLHNDRSSDIEGKSKISIMFEWEGSSYAPTLAENSTIQAEWDIKVFIKPEEILGSDEWKNILISMEENKQKRIKREEENKKAKEIKDREQAEYEKKLKAYNDYMRLKKEFEVATKPIKPKAPPKSEFQKILEKIKKEQKKVEVNK